MPSPEVDQLTDEELRAWDWRAELKRQRRSVPWLARQTDRADQTVYQYGRGVPAPSIAWLRSAWAILAASDDQGRDHAPEPLASAHASAAPELTESEQRAMWGDR